MYFFDTNIIIDFLRGRLPQALKLLNGTDVRLIKIPAVVEAELLLGARKSANPEKNRRALESFLCNFEIIPFDSKCAHCYADIRAELESAGKVIGPNNLLIAATALAHDGILATNNVRDFKRIDRLRLMSIHELDL